MAARGLYHFNVKPATIKIYNRKQYIVENIIKIKITMMCWRDNETGKLFFLKKRRVWGGL